jgi:UDP-N-acetyl-D-glucosamine dehydrogenase
LKANGLRAGNDFFLGFSPEREDPGNAKFDTKSIPKIVGADDAHSRDLLDRFYSHIVTRTVPVSSLATAEAVKLAENSFRTVNIALVNEMKVAMEAMGVDVWEVVQAAATKPFRLYALLSWSGYRRRLYSGVSGLSFMESTRRWFVYADYRSGAQFNNDGEPDRLAGRVAVELGKRGCAIGRGRVS